MGNVYKDLKTIEVSISGGSRYLEGKVGGSLPADGTLNALGFLPGLVFSQLGAPVSTPPDDIWYGLSGGLYLSAITPIAGIVLLNDKYTGKDVSESYNVGSYCFFRIPRKGDLVVLRDALGTLIFGDSAFASADPDYVGYIIKAVTIQELSAVAYKALEGSTFPGDTVVCEVL